MRLILLRHPETYANEQGLIYGKTDYPYTQKGIEQMKKAIDNMKRFPVTEIVSSPLRRANQLAKAVALDKGIPLSKEERLEELNQGVLEGLTKEAAKCQYPEVYEGLMLGDMNFAPPNGESYSQFERRVSQWFEGVSWASDGCLLVVTHGGVIRTLLEILLDVGKGISWQIDVDNCVIIDLDLCKKYGKIRNIINLDI